MKRMFLIIILALPVVPCLADIINVPWDQPTIQQGINNANNGDTVLVANGIFMGAGNRDISLNGLAICLMSQNGPSYTIIDCEGTAEEHHRGFNIEDGEDTTTVIDGFTIRNGYAGSGGGIRCYQSSPKISNCIISDNSAAHGGGIYFNGGAPGASAPILLGCVLAGNHANSPSGFGGGIYIQFCGIELTMQNCILNSNSAAYGGSMAFGENAIVNMLNCTLTKNTADNGGGVYTLGGSAGMIENSIIAFNHPGEGILCQEATCAPDLICCDIYGNLGGDWTGHIADQQSINNNFAKNPLFCDTMYHDYRLENTSPCHPDSSVCGLIGTREVGCLPLPAPHIICSSPTPNEICVPAACSIFVEFNDDIDESSITDTTFCVYGASTGCYSGGLSYSEKVATFIPSSNPAVGEVLSVSLTTDIISLRGAPLASGYTWSFTAKSCECPANFIPNADYSVGSDPISMCSADLDNDADMDIITLSRASDSITVLFNNGNGLFGNRVDYPVGDSPHGVIAADVDADGDPDLITANRNAGTISVLKNIGNGTFAAHIEYTAGSGTTAICAADLDRDGDLDLAAANAGTSMSILLNTGDGSFASPVAYGDSNPSSVFCGDFDGDYDIDIVVSNWTGPPSLGHISLFMNNGNAVFSHDSSYQIDIGHSHVYGSDLNSDGALDLITQSHYSDLIYILLNNGFGKFDIDSSYSVGTGPRTTVAADLDGDNDQDICVPNYYDNNISVLFNNGDGTFADRVNFETGEWPMWAIAADLNGDGKLDLATQNNSSQDVSVLFNANTCEGICGDANDDATVNVSDAVYIINYVFVSGPLPVPLACGDANSDTTVNVSDAVYLINYVFVSGPLPDDCSPGSGNWIDGDCCPFEW